VRSTSREFGWNSFLFLSLVRTVVPCHPDGRTSTASNFLIKASHVRTGEMVVRTVDLMYAISISNARASRPCWLAYRRLDFECDTCLMNKWVRTGIHVVRTVAAIFPWSLRVVRTCCWNVRTGASGWYDISSRWLAIWKDGRLDGMTRRPNGWQGTKFFALQIMQNLLKALLNSGIPIKKYLYKEVILSNKMWPITN